MPTVIINDTAYEAQIGERLLDVARRNAAHIGFVCDGNGVCQTCQCRVLQGSAQLNGVNEVERTWLPESRIAAGNRLACQAALRGEGTVEVLTLVEELRRQILGVVSPPTGSSTTESLSPLVENLVRLNADQLRLFPFNAVRTFMRLGPVRFFWPYQDVSKFLDDSLRVTRRMLGDGQTNDADRQAAALKEAAKKVMEV